MSECACDMLVQNHELDEISGEHSGSVTVPSQFEQQKKMEEYVVSEEGVVGARYGQKDSNSPVNCDRLVGTRSLDF